MSARKIWEYNNNSSKKVFHTWHLLNWLNKVLKIFMNALKVHMEIPYILRKWEVLNFVCTLNCCTNLNLSIFCIPLPFECVQNKKIQNPKHFESKNEKRLTILLIQNKFQRFIYGTQKLINDHFTIEELRTIVKLLTEILLT